MVQTKNKLHDKKYGGADGGCHWATLRLEGQSHCKDNCPFPDSCDPMQNRNLYYAWRNEEILRMSGDGQSLADIQVRFSTVTARIFYTVIGNARKS